MNNVEALFHYNRKLSQISRVSGSRSKMSKGDTLGIFPKNSERVTLGVVRGGFFRGVVFGVLRAFFREPPSRGLHRPVQRSENK